MSGGSHPELALRPAAVQVESCKDCTPAFWVEDSRSSTCARCALVEPLKQRLDGVLFKPLQEVLGPCVTNLQGLPDKELQQ